MSGFYFQLPLHEVNDENFNAFQSVSFFTAAPFGLVWVADQHFRGSGIAFWVGCAIYLVGFALNVAAVRYSIDKIDW